VVKISCFSKVSPEWIEVFQPTFACAIKNTCSAENGFLKQKFKIIDGHPVENLPVARD